ncbi:Metal homeostatis protein BSD2 [Psilocybe cubensis]|nr:Metal homeostatis protein BSD2 [Psilocybe cubensis]KAH9482378.1 Metal homeostatis protein BSD2 [Psilocybe cubensis]
MAHRYASVPNPGPDHEVTQRRREDEMQAAFDYSDDEDDDHNSSEAQPLNPTPTSPTRTHPPPAQSSPGTYNFESVDYDYPPPGSPPPPSAVALPNNYGNSNGFIPTFDVPQNRGSSRMWFRRAASSILPASVLTRIGVLPQRPSGPVGGGTNNDGVFANVTAKPTAPVRVQDGDDIHIVPEDTIREAPPSYASAQADAVPPYWETTIHAPFAPDSVGDMIIDSLPTGSLFSFCWNLLVSISFQFVGFLLTYLLHTSHAARLGSRAGLGVTLIQYGFALRTRLDQNSEVNTNNDWNYWNPESTSGTGTIDSSSTSSIGNFTWSSPNANITDEQTSAIVADATTEWLSFFLMTVGWFVLLTSLLGFWRVKRWERGILASRRENQPPAPRNGPAIGIVSHLESSFGLRGVSRSDFFRQGFGLGPRRPDADETIRAAEEGDAPHSAEAQETDPMLTLDPADPNSRAVIEAYANEQRLQRDLREAGLLLFPAAIMSLKIRQATEKDAPFLSQICLRTGDAGKTAEHLHDFGELPGLVYAVPYVKLPTTWGFVLEREGSNEVVGYILGSTDTRAYEKYASEHCWPALAEKYSPEKMVKPADIHYAKLLHNMHTAPDANIAFSPAHLHIDILEDYQKQGWGRKLIATAVRFLAEQGLEGVWLGLDPRNEGARKFYQRLRFVNIEGAPDANQMGLRFVDFE